MSHTCCFVANYHLTPLQSALAKRLERRGVVVCWVVVNYKILRYLQDEGWSRERIVHLSLELAQTGPLFTEFAVKFNDLLHADRALRHAPSVGLDYLHAAAHRLQAFFDSMQPDYVFGENTWAHERLSAMLCAGSGGRRQYLSPHTVRFPAGRWGFFVGEDQTELRRGRPQGARDLETGKSIAVTPPLYVQRNNELLAQSKTFRARIQRLKRFVTRENIDATDPTHIQSRWATFRTKGYEEVNRFVYERLVRRLWIDDVALERPFVLYAMHKQPESSIDVLGRYYEDQTKVIHAIWRTLPTGWSLYVKEHTNAIGDRGPSFYRAINRMPNAYVVDEQAPAAVLLKACRAVFTVTGTIAYEAALLKKPAFTFVPMFFNALKYCSRVSIDDLRKCQDLRELIEKVVSRPDADDVFDIESRSFLGKFTDVYTDPTVLDDANLALVESAFMSLLEV